MNALPTGSAGPQIATGAATSTPATAGAGTSAPATAGAVTPAPVAAAPVPVRRPTTRSTSSSDAISPSAGERPGRRPAEFAEADAQLADVLDSLGDADNYLDFQASLISPYLRGPVLEVGAGLGHLTTRWRRTEPVVATDISTRCLRHLNELADEDSGLESGPYDVTQPADAPHRPLEGFGSAVMSNVLEHLPDDVEALRHLGNQVKTGGHVVVFVPAFECLYGRFDEMIGHHRRYRADSLTEAFYAASLEPVDVRYVNLPGWFAWLATVRLLGRVPTAEGAIGAYDRFVVPLLQRVETRVAPPFGQSLLGVARVPDEWVRVLKPGEQGTQTAARSRSSRNLID